MLVILTGLELVVLSQSSQVCSKLIGVESAGLMLVLVIFTGVELVELLVILTGVELLEVLVILTGVELLVDVQSCQVCSVLVDPAGVLEELEDT